MSYKADIDFDDNKIVVRRYDSGWLIELLSDLHYPFPDSKTPSEKVVAAEKLLQEAIAATGVDKDHDEFGPRVIVALLGLFFVRDIRFVASVES